MAVYRPSKDIELNAYTHPQTLTNNSPPVPYTQTPPPYHQQQYPQRGFHTPLLVVTLVFSIIAIVISILAIVITQLQVGNSNSNGITDTNAKSGINGTNGFHCYDTNQNHLCDQNEDINNDNVCDIYDCRGFNGTNGKDSASNNLTQVISKNGTSITLSNNGGEVTLNDDDSTNELQTLSKTGITISLSKNGSSIDLDEITTLQNQVTNLQNVIASLQSQISLITRIFAFVTFDGSACTPNCPILYSSNVNLVTRTNQGQFTINFATPTSDSNYLVSGNSIVNTVGTGRGCFISSADTTTPLTTSYAKIDVTIVDSNQGTYHDSPRIQVIFTR